MGAELLVKVKWLGSHSIAARMDIYYTPPRIMTSSANVNTDSSCERRIRTRRTEDATCVNSGLMPVQPLALNRMKVQHHHRFNVKSMNSGDGDGDKKRKYNSVSTEVDITAEEMEAYRLKKDRTDDPIAQFGSEEILAYKK